jgi:predicted nucleic acid-binding protein
VAAAIDGGPAGRWAEDTLLRGNLAAPHLVPAEVTNVLRRAVLADRVPGTVARSALQDVLRLDIELFPFAPFGPRVWQLRATLTAYDAWYVALAEALKGSLATLDRRLTGVSGPRCRFLIPPDDR